MTMELSLSPDRFREMFPHASKSTLKANGQIPDPQPKCNQAPALGRAVQGEKQSVGRIRVSFTGYRVRPLDPDGFAGSTKDLLDGLRRAGLIPDDSWRHIKLETEQEQVAHFNEERTEITITWPET